MTHEELVVALRLMMRLRDKCRYRSRGFLILNSACWHLSNQFWIEAGHPENCHPIPKVNA